MNNYLSLYYIVLQVYSSFIELHFSFQKTEIVQ